MTQTEREGKQCRVAQIEEGALKCWTEFKEILHCNY